MIINSTRATPYDFDAKDKEREAEFRRKTRKLQAVAAGRKPFSGDATITSSTVLAGYTGYGKGGVLVVGTIPTFSGVIMPTTTDYTEYQSYYFKNARIKGDVNLLPENIRKGFTLFGVEGTYEGD